MSNHKTGEWMDCTIAAKPASKKARHPYATVTAVFYVEGEYPDREVAERIINAPVLLDAAEKRLAAVEAERDAMAVKLGVAWADLQVMRAVDAEHLQRAVRAEAERDEAQAEIVELRDLCS